MAKSIGDPLFTGRRLHRYMDALPTEITEWARHHYDEEKLRGAELIVKLRERFRLEPVILGPVTTITIQAQPWRDRSPVADSQAGYLAYARVPWSGSRIFLQTRIDPGFRASFAAKIGRTALRIGRFEDTLDLTGFRNAADNEVEQMREVLATFQADALAYDEQVRRLVERAVEADNLL